MAYRVPTTEVLVAAIATAISDMTTIGSQNQFTELVREELRRIDPLYGVTEERVRRTSIAAGLVKVSVETRDTGIRMNITLCPVCGSRLQRIRNCTIPGDVAIIGKDCPTCPFRMGMTRRVPSRYLFSRARPRGRPSKRDGQRTL